MIWNCRYFYPLKEEEADVSIIERQLNFFQRESTVDQKSKCDRWNKGVLVGKRSKSRTFEMSARFTLTNSSEEHSVLPQSETYSLNAFTSPFISITAK